MMNTHSAQNRSNPHMWFRIDDHNNALWPLKLLAYTSAINIEHFSNRDVLTKNESLTNALTMLQVNNPRAPQLRLFLCCDHSR